MLHEKVVLNEKVSYMGGGGVTTGDIETDLPGRGSMPQTAVPASSGQLSRVCSPEAVLIPRCPIPPIRTRSPIRSIALTDRVGRSLTR